MPGSDGARPRLVAVGPDGYCGFSVASRVSGMSLWSVCLSRDRVGSRLLRAFADHARRAGARELSVVLDTQAQRRWERRGSSCGKGFASVNGSALHFTKPLDT
ncbi:hypothetical protein [Nocardia wallacei]|uniref:hypothetical protein n=1 Tax=Nocardia wallacei TaxID=480035 RepID=UPI002454371F|nr:hypothetical protein [Nocardia wallacei]